MRREKSAFDWPFCLECGKKLDPWTEWETRCTGNCERQPMVREMYSAQEGKCGICLTSLGNGKAWALSWKLTRIDKKGWKLAHSNCAPHAEFVFLRDSGLRLF